jgi:hypothetical protein
VTQRTQFDRSYTTGEVASGTQPDGTPFVNFPDRRLQVHSPLGAIDLLAVRAFSEDADYSGGDVVVNAGGIYSAKVAIPAGPFDPTEWDSLISNPFSPFTGAAGWDFTVGYTEGLATEVVYVSGTSQCRLTIGYNTDENAETVLYETSVNSGVDWTTVGTLTITYDAEGNPNPGGVWS